MILSPKTLVHHDRVSVCDLYLALKPKKPENLLGIIFVEKNVSNI